MLNRKLAFIWAFVPSPGCKGLCVESCGPIECSEAEREQLAQIGFHLPPIRDGFLALMRDSSYTCPALIKGRCSVYEVRPLVCRLWGSVEGMPCPWGCEPEGGRISDVMARELFKMAEDLSPTKGET